MDYFACKFAGRLLRPLVLTGRAPGIQPTSIYFTEDKFRCDLLVMLGDTSLSSVSFQQQLKVRLYLPINSMAADIFDIEYYQTTLPWQVWQKVLMSCMSLSLGLRK